MGMIFEGGKCQNSAAFLMGPFCLFIPSLEAKFCVSLRGQKTALNCSEGKIKLLLSGLSSLCYRGPHLDKRIMFSSTCIL